MENFLIRLNTLINLSIRKMGQTLCAKNCDGIECIAPAMNHLVRTIKPESNKNISSKDECTKREQIKPYQQSHKYEIGHVSWFLQLR